MQKITPWMLLTTTAAGLFTISFFRPNWLNDNNTFLHNFVNHELLATLGFIAAVTLASAASLHFELNRLEESTSANFSRSRRSICRSAYSLLFLFGAAIILVVIKPILQDIIYVYALVNSLALIILFFYISVMWDITATVLAIPTIRKLNALCGQEEV